MHVSPWTCNYAGLLYTIGDQQCQNTTDCRPAKTVEVLIDNKWSTMKGIEFEVHSKSYYPPLDAALQRTLLVSGNAKQNDRCFQPLRSGIYLMQGSTIQYYDPDVSRARCGLLAPTPKLHLTYGANAMLAHKAMAMPSGEVDSSARLYCNIGVPGMLTMVLL